MLIRYIKRMDLVASVAGKERRKSLKCPSQPINIHLLEKKRTLRTGKLLLPKKNKKYEVERAEKRLSSCSFRNSEPCQARLPAVLSSSLASGFAYREGPGVLAFSGFRKLTRQK